MNEQEKAIADYLSRLSVNTSAICFGEQCDDNNWTHDAWSITLTRPGKKFSTSYRAGTGHRKNGRPVPPPAAGVLYSLLSDANGAEQAFDLWCDDYGYDTDSRSAFATYEACCEVRRKLHAFFSRAELKTLGELLLDY